MTWQTALVLAAGLHAGFQLTVSMVVYPALAEVGQGAWGSAHAGHSRRITPVVGIAYVSAAVACAGALLTDPTYGAWLAAIGTAAAFAVTGFVAVPLHGRLSHGPDAALLRRLLRTDWIRTGCALLALLGALLNA